MWGALINWRSRMSSKYHTSYAAKMTADCSTLSHNADGPKSEYSGGGAKPKVGGKDIPFSSAPLPQIFIIPPSQLPPHSLQFHFEIC